VSDRERALRILERIEVRKLAAHEAIAREPGVEHHDFVRTLVHGVLRWQGRLDYAIATLADRKASRIDPIVLRILRLGAYQVWFTDVPPYAAVSESTELAGKVARRAKSFVNAVMRRVSERTIESLDPTGSSIADVAVRASHPEWLVEQWTRTYGSERAEAIARADQDLSYPDLLVNARRWSRDDALSEILERGLHAEPAPFAENVIRLRSGTGPLADLVRHGRVYPMDEGSAAVTSLVPDDAVSVLDLCAAPGGKSLALGLRYRRVVSCDLSMARLGTLRRSARRFFGVEPRLCVTDALQPGLRGTFDAVLVDAPCSATGTIRRNPEVRWRVSKEELVFMSMRQTTILDRALDLAGRYVLYVTCSLEPEENDRVVEAVTADRSDVVARDLTPFTPLSLRRWLDGGVLRLTPESGSDGFTATLLERIR
jgi:16S rRNA (cytosine967-C5)-methyltransferase